MFVDDFWIQAAFFLALLAVALGNMRSGRFGLGFLQFVLVWVFADFALLARFVFDEPGISHGTWLMAMQVVMLLSVPGFLFAVWRRGRAGFRQEQAKSYATALAAFMAGRDEEAGEAFRNCYHLDPWDAEALSMLALCQARQGRQHKARRSYKKALALSTQPILQIEIKEELRLLRKATKQGSQTTQGSPPTVPRKRRMVAS